MATASIPIPGNLLCKYSYNKSLALSPKKVYNIFPG
jgi:hypothetical protein